MYRLLFLILYHLMQAFYMLSKRFSISPGWILLLPTPTLSLYLWYYHNPGK